MKLLNIFTFIGNATSARAPQGCLQYFTGIQSTVKSFNFDGSIACTTGCEISAQDYRACFRQEAGLFVLSVP